MKITIPRATILPALVRAAAVADRKSTLPVLECVLLSADATGLRVAATDLYSSVAQTVPCETKTEGAIALPASSLLSRIKAMPSGNITISADSKFAVTITAKGSKRKFTMHALPATDFPAIPEMPGTADILEHVPTETLSLLIAQTIFSASQDESRAHLNGALFEFSDGKLRLVTTDGHRLSVADAQIGAEAKADVVVGLRALQTWTKVLSDKAAPEKVLFAKHGPYAFLRVGEVDFATKLPPDDQPFIPYRNILPQRAKQEVRCNRSSLIDAIEAVRLASSDKQGVVRITANGALRVDAESAGSGNAFDEVAADYDGAEVTVGFNPTYLLDALKAVRCDEVLLSLTGELDPATIVPALASSGDASDTIHIVMPTRP